MHHSERARRHSASNINPPSAWLAATELPRAIAEAGLFTASLPQLLACAPRGDGHPVLVIPGFLASDTSTTPLRRALGLLGYDVRGWGLGRNVGPRSVGTDGGKLTQLIDKIHEETGSPVSLVGWSLGGVLARISAASTPGAVRQVITLGSPFAGSPRATNAWKLYEKVSGAPLRGADQNALMRTARRPLAVPSTAVFSRADGICAWEICRGPSSPRSENIEVHGSHCGLGANPSVFLIVADRLAQSDDDWSPFEPQALTGWMFPASTCRGAD